MTVTTPQPGQVIGHDAAQAELVRLWAGGSGPRTLLLAGPDGVGRRAVAHWFAAYVNCARREPAGGSAAPDGRTGAGAGEGPCWQCPSCLAAAAGTHVDVREVGPGERTKGGRSTARATITIDRLVSRQGGDAEPLGEWLRTRPQHRYRVGIIDGAGSLTEGAANAFLKTLEEPPSWAVIVLIATGQDSLLPTVASRCTTVRLGPVELHGFDDLLGHPGLRLGQPGALLRARAAGAATNAARRAAEELLAALSGDLIDLLATAESFAKAVADASEAGVRPGPLGWLLEPLRELEPLAYAEAADAVARCEQALAGYAQASLACTVLALELRRVAASGADAGRTDRGAGLRRTS